MDKVLSLHRRVWDLIPWVVNGSANEDDRRLVDNHLLECAECREEYDFHCQIKVGVESQPPLMFDDAGPGLKQLLARIDARHARPPRPAAASARAHRRASPMWVRMLIAVCACQAAALGTLGLAYWDQRHAAGHRTLSDAGRDGAGAAIRFVPAPTMTLEQLHVLLARVDLRVVEVSAEGGIFGPELPAGSDSQDRHRALEALRAERGVLLAEPIAAPPPQRAAGIVQSA